MYSRKQKDGSYRSFIGGFYIQLVHFIKNGVEVETINFYGANANISIKYSTSQMEDYTNQKI